jgi:2-keto-4-pentenoate hydratase/2-oxohepta-3-ene-1,7-dioic acid hydratase in catechol pathway
MKIARVNQKGQARTGIVVDDTIELLHHGTDVLELLEVGPGERAEIVSARNAGEPVAVSGADLLAPIEPASLRDFVTFEEHMRGMVKGHEPGAVPPEWFDAPTFYFTSVAAVTGPFDHVRIPPQSKAFDFELEVAAVIGKGGYNLSVDEARDHIAGYTILNDWSARDLQYKEMNVRLGPCKGKDSANTLGPWIVTADELAPYEKDRCWPTPPAAPTSAPATSSAQVPVAGVASASAGDAASAVTKPRHWRPETKSRSQCRQSGQSATS